MFAQSGTLAPQSPNLRNKGVKVYTVNNLANLIIHHHFNTHTLHI